MNATADVRFLPQTHYEQVDTRFDVEYGVYWAFMNPRPRSCFNLGLLEELRGYIDTIVDEQVAISIQKPLITRPEPPMEESLAVVLWRLGISLHDIQATYDNLADSPRQKEDPNQRQGPEHQRRGDLLRSQPLHRAVEQNRR